jgi:hypothetical protein
MSRGGAIAWGAVLGRPMGHRDQQAFREEQAAADEIMRDFPGIHARPAPVRGGGWGLAVSTRSGSCLQTVDREQARAWAEGHAGAAPEEPAAGIILGRDGTPTGEGTPRLPRVSRGNRGDGTFTT